MAERCEHFSAIQPVKASVDGCEDCLAIGATWNELRVCLTCGHVGCCEDSQHAHALQHFKATGHPIIASFEPTETWGWCYIDRCYFDPMPGQIPKRRTGLKALLGKLGWR
ncbi:MAG TPA: UBP-type zinc finger domain-containing protein [Casimicrobiaceae bacterium]|nr:UBP-type zinc finger domain-containing protein [Casimicrobiaceae bacterium]